MSEVKKTELLLPAGNIEAFYAAIEGGADAIYLGLHDFNARARAKNFSIQQLVSLIETAHKNKVKLYITLNTLIQNHELKELLKILHVIKQNSVDALIIQDLGLYYLVKKYFPEIKLHASTQMAVHNLAGARYFSKLGFERVILSRELSMKELELIADKSPIQLEVFVHGALCYSFSGMCLFSSFLGGHGANRGLCAQPCRRSFIAEEKESALFSMKDNELIDFLADLQKMKIASLKIEGRMKSADYVYRVAKAYRMVLDNPEKIAEAKKILDFDLGRDKTQWFKANNVNDAITENTVTGRFAGIVSKVEQGFVYIESNLDFSAVRRIRFLDAAGKQQKYTAKTYTKFDNLVRIEKPDFEVKHGDKVFIAAIKENKFPTQIEDFISPKKNIPENRNLFSNLNNLKNQQAQQQTKIFMRVDHIDWLKKIHFESIDALILHLDIKDYETSFLENKFFRKNQHKIWIELPRFISELSANKYRDLIKSLQQKEYNRFFISHISQLEYMPENAIVATNEHVYVLNDFAAMFLKEQQIKYFTYPLESGVDNLIQSKNKTGIVPLYFYPELFYSRQPIKASDKIIDDEQRVFSKRIKDNMTVVIPEFPVSLLQYSNKLKAKGFRNFLIDLSYEKPSQNVAKKIIKRFQSAQQIQPSDNFNFKRGLK